MTIAHTTITDQILQQFVNEFNNTSFLNWKDLVLYIKHYEGNEVINSQVSVQFDGTGHGDGQEDFFLFIQSKHDTSKTGFICITFCNKIKKSVSVSLGGERSKINF